ncbi:MAG: alanyl-tRNA editing protein [Treponema sp.]|jgi:alanyl-tRNA synthetase|nr:alanyl-tRNA editing protein [Treponema sp.]
MQTQRAWYDHSGPEVFRANIIEVRPQSDAAAIILDRTIFYPEGGGQGADRGTINGIPLLDVQEKNGEILHLISAENSSTENAAALSPGPAELILDIRRRRDLTVQHTAQHLLSGTILRLTGKYTVSMHLGDEQNTIDVDAPELSADVLAAVEEAVADAIEADNPVIIHHCPPEDVNSFPLRKVPPKGEEVIRVVEIAGNDFSPCCGTHCTRTGQIGMLRILGAEKYKGMTRVSFIAGRRVLNDSRLLRQNGDVISRALKVPVEETGKGVLALLEKTGRVEQEFKALQEADAEAKAAALIQKISLADQTSGANEAVADTEKIWIEHYPEAGIDEILRTGRAAQKKTSVILLLVSDRELKFAAFCGVKGKNLKPLFEDPLGKAGGRGGGGPGFFQGSFSSAEALNNFLKAIRK